jgi:dTDP-4-amino-4,6-dideoxygalactose transaminase
MPENVTHKHKWYALTVPYQHERLTEQALQSKGLETLLPVYRSLRRWSDRVKEVEVPLFAGYVLCRFDLTDRVEVMDTPGVARIVGFGGAPAALEDSEIAAIQQLVASKAPLTPWPYLKTGDRVRVERGPMRGLEGTLLRTKDALCLVIGVELLQRSVTRHTRAILPTHLNGRTADMQALDAIAKRHGLAIVEDAAQALGSRFQGRPAGGFGAAAAISFFPAKTLGCLGDGGAVVTNNAEVYERVVQLRDHGRRADGEIVSWGLNSRLDNLQAAILDHRLASYEGVVERRRALAALYHNGLQSIQEIQLPPGPDANADHFDCFQNYEIEAERRDELRAWLTARRIGTALPWGGKAVHQWPRLGFEAQLPFTERLFERVLLLPLNLSLSPYDVHTICNTIQDFYQSSSRKRG